MCCNRLLQFETRICACCMSHVIHVIESCLTFGLVISQIQMRHRITHTHKHTTTHSPTHQPTHSPSPTHRRTPLPLTDTHIWRHRSATACPRRVQQRDTARRVSVYRYIIVCILKIHIYIYIYIYIYMYMFVHIYM